MTVKTSGPLALSEIYNEFKDRDGVTVTNETGDGTRIVHNLGEYYNADLGVPSSGALDFSDFYGKSDVFEYIYSNKAGDAFYNNVDAVADIKAAGWNGQSKVVITVQGKIRSTSASTPAFKLDFNSEAQGAPQKITIRVANTGAILGRGGNGGGVSGGNGQDGADGGPAMFIRNKTYNGPAPWNGLKGSVTIDNRGYICGGGGGGGGMLNRGGQSHSGGGGGGAGGGNGGSVNGTGQSHTGGAGATAYLGGGSNGGGHTAAYTGKGGGAGGGGGGWTSQGVNKNQDATGAGGGGGLNPVGTGGAGSSQGGGAGGNYVSGGGTGDDTGGGGGWGQSGGAGQGTSGGAGGKAISVSSTTTTFIASGGITIGANDAD